MSNQPLTAESAPQLVIEHLSKSYTVGGAPAMEGRDLLEGGANVVEIDLWMVAKAPLEWPPGIVVLDTVADEGDELS